jgi:8-oxo-dGTP pyrophosphatase MutT (NUDIX family)
MEKTPFTLPWRTIRDERIGRYSIFELIRSFRKSPKTGQTHEFIRIVSPDWVNVIAVTDDGDFVLVEQFRHGNDQATLEIPGGAVDPGEDPTVAAARELEEETGFRPATLELIGIVDPNPAFLSNRCYTYLATGCRCTGSVNPDPSEEIELVTAPLADFGRLISDGRITHSLIISAHYHLLTGLVNHEPWTHRIARWCSSPTS